MSGWLKLAGVAVLVVVASLSVRQCQRALRAEGEANSLREQREGWRATRIALEDSIALSAQERATLVASLEREREVSDSLREVASRETETAVQQASAAGEDLLATLDSIEVTVPELELVRIARAQFAEHLDADRRAIDGFRAQLAEMFTLLTLSDSTARLHRGEAGDLRRLLDVTRRERDLAITEAGALRVAIHPGFFADLGRFGTVFGAGAIVGGLAVLLLR